MRAGVLIVDIAGGVARLQQDMGKAVGIVQGATRDIERFASTARSALASIGVGVGVGALASMAADIIKATAALDDMAETTGSTVETLSQLQVAARISGKDFATIEDGLVKLTKGLKGADEEAGNTAHALDFLGIKAKDASGKLRDPGVILQEVALRLAEFKDGSDKTAIALDLFGKSGAQLLPFLKDLAEQGKINTRVTAEQAAAAEQLEKNLNRLKLAGEEARREFLMGVTPALVDMTNKLIDAQKAAGNLATALLMMSMTDTSNVGATLAKKRAELAELENPGEGLDSLKNLSLADFWPGGRSRAISGTRMQIAYLEALQARRMRELGAGLGYEDAAGNIGPAPAAPRLGYLSPGKEDKDKKATGKTLADVLNESAGVSKGFYEDLKKLHEGYQAGTITLETYRTAVEKLIEKQGFARDLAQQRTEEIKKATEASKQEFEAEQKRGKQMLEFINTANKENDQLEFEVSLIGMSTAERERAVAIRKIEVDLKQKSIGLSEEERESLRREADEAKARTNTLLDQKNAREQLVKFRDEQQAEWERLWGAVESTGKTVFAHLMGEGKNAFESIGRTIKASLIDLLYQLTIRPWIINIGTSIAGSLGIQTAQSALGGGGLFGGNAFAGGGGVGFGFPSPMSFMNSIGGGVFAAGTGGAASIAALTPAMEAAMLTGSGMASAGVATAGGALAGIGAALPWVGAGLFAANALGLFGDDSEPPPGHRRENTLQLTSAGDPYGRVGLIASEVPDPQVLQGLIAELSTVLNDPTRYDPAILRSLEGTTARVPPGGNSQQLVSQMLAALAPAAAAAQERAQAAAQAAAGEARRAAEAELRGEARAMLDPMGHWRAQVETLAGQMQTSARTPEAWRGSFMRDLDALPASAVQTGIELHNALTQLEALQREERNREAQRAAEAAAESSARAGIAMQLRAANDPYGQQMDLGARLGSSARTVQEWRDAFLAVIESLTPAQIEDWREFGELIEQTSTSAAAFADRRTTLEGSLGDLAGSLPGRLGIASLEQARASLAVSEYVAPLERFSAARAALFSSYGSAVGGDLDAVRGFPQLLQSALGVGRDVYASGPQFAEFFVEGNRMLQDLIAKQQGLQADILRDVPEAILQSSANEVEEIRKQTAQLVQGLAEVKEEIARLQGALAA